MIMEKRKALEIADLCTQIGRLDKNIQEMKRDHIEFNHGLIVYQNSLLHKALVNELTQSKLMLEDKLKEIK